MKSIISCKSRTILWRAEGKGTLGCLISLALLGAGAFVLYSTGPTYYAYKSFEADVQAEVSRAGANFYEDEKVILNLLDLARRNEIRLTRENLKVERFAGQLHINIHYSVPLELLVYQRTVDFHIKASSFVGRL